MITISQDLHIKQLSPGMWTVEPGKFGRLELWLWGNILATSATQLAAPAPALALCKMGPNTILM